MTTDLTGQHSTGRSDACFLARIQLLSQQRLVVWPIKTSRAVREGGRPVRLEILACRAAVRWADKVDHADSRHA
jgi:hypothetical protein